MIVKMKFCILVPTVVSLCISSVAISKAQAATFTKIADTSDSLSKFSLPAINDQGLVVFNALSNTGNQAILSGDGTTIRTIIDTSGQFSSFGAPTVNNSGTVASYGFLDNGSKSVFTINSGNITTIADSSSGQFNSFETPYINDKGTVAFAASLPNKESGVFTGNGGSLNTIALAPSRDFGLVDSVYGPTPINNQGTVAFRGNSANIQSIYALTGRTGTSVASSFGPYRSFNSVSLNNSDIVAFSASTSSFTGEVVTNNTGLYNQYTTIANTVGAYGSLDKYNQFGSVSINDQGNVAFLAQFGIDKTGIFTGAIPSRDKVIGTGDTLLGSAVVNLSFFEKGLNNKNQIAFYAQLADGRSGIFRADLAKVPEPTPIFGTLILAILSFTRNRKRHL